MTNVVKAFEPDIYRLADDLRSEWFDYIRLHKISDRIVAMYGRAVLKQVLNIALGSSLTD